MPRYLLHHEHGPAECGAVFASFAGHAGPLRHQPTIGSCRFGGHAIPVHYEGWKHFKQGRSGIERESSRSPEAFRTAVRCPPIGAPADVVI